MEGNRQKCQIKGRVKSSEGTMGEKGGDSMTHPVTAYARSVLSGKTPDGHLVRLGAAAISSALTGRTSTLDLKKPRKCRLSSCDNLTLHNGGFCCADHCKQDRIEKGMK